MKKETKLVALWETSFCCQLDSLLRLVYSNLYCHSIVKLLNRRFIFNLATIQVEGRSQISRCDKITYMWQNPNDLSVFLQSLYLSLVTLYPQRDEIPILDIAHIEGKVSPKLFQTLSQCYIISKTNGTCFSLFTYSTIILVVKISFLINCKFSVHALCNQMLSFALIISISSNQQTSKF